MPTYAAEYLVRFQGTLTQGPNIGKTYDWLSSWGGVSFETEAEAKELLDSYKSKEPNMEFRLVKRQYIHRKGIVETILG